MSPSIPSPKTRVFFFSHPRTASNLLVKLLSEQEGWSYSDYNFHPAYQYAIRNLNFEDPSQTSLESLTEYSNHIALACKNLEKFLSTAEESVSDFT
jgi:DNA-directed RNA polymerase subunit L